MAEAHAAVAFSFSVGPEGVDINLNNEAVKAVWQSGVLSWKKRVGSLKNDIINTVFPSGPISLCLIVTVVVSIWVVLGVDISCGFIPLLRNYLLGFSLFGEKIEFYVSCVIFSIFVWILKIILRKYLLQLLLSYQGWIYEVRGPISLHTKIWHVLLKLIGGSNPLLKSWQGSLPKLPVPSVHDTVQQYLESIKPICTADKYKHIANIAIDFEKGLGKKLQRYLVLKSWWSSNYVSDWWEQYVYLKGRSPIMVNSNFYGLDCILALASEVQVARAANMVYSMMMFRREVERETLKPLMLNKTVPLCSAQYDRLFNTTRIPGKDIDKLVHLTNSTHIVVHHKGRFFKMQLRRDNRYYTPPELEIMFQKIVDDDSYPAPGEMHLAALTAGPRVQWAEAREKFFAKGKNRLSLKAIEKAAFFVALDDVPYTYNPNNPRELNNYAQMMLHGHCSDRWFDKSFNLCVGSNGRIGFNGEHAWAESPILAHFVEYTVAEDFEMGYTKDGHTVGEPEFKDVSPYRLEWEISDECQDVIESSLSIAQKLADDVDLYLVVFNDFGKAFIKTCGVSPDAFVQMALQLTNYRDTGKFCLTYESAMTRLFREGRTETVRSCTVESSAFVLSMSDSAIPKEEKRKLFRRAATKHVDLYRRAMIGKGIDRHLFCLYVVSQYLGDDCEFLRTVLGEPWRLSTSQTPQQQTEKLDLNKNPNYISGGGGFGPVADDGYGVSYMISGDTTISLHISSKRSSPMTNSERFATNLRQSLFDIKELFSDSDSMG